MLLGLINDPNGCCGVAPDLGEVAAVLKVNDDEVFVDGACVPNAKPVVVLFVDVVGVEELKLNTPGVNCCPARFLVTVGEAGRADLCAA